MAKFNPIKQYNFVLADRNLAAKGGSVTFKSYTDYTGSFTGQPGTPAQYIVSKDEHGKDKPKWFSLSQQHYNFTVREGESDIHGRSQYDFLINHPQCEGSPNGTYNRDERGEIVIREDGKRDQLGVLFKLMNTAADAEIALDAAIRKTKAEASALELDDETLQDVAAHIGIFGAPDKLMQHRVYQYAGKYPIDYFQILESGDRPVRAIIRKAISQGIFTTKGEVIMWGSTVVGPNEDGAVSNLLRDGKDILEALRKKMGLSLELNVKGKPGPKAKLEKTK